MTQRILVSTLLFASLLSAVPGQRSQAQAPADSRQVAIDHAVNSVKPALVRVFVVSTSYREGRELKYQSSGSGVIISAEGYVVTNHHVAGHAKRLMCTLSDKSEVEAELVGTDALTDIAVIKLLRPEPGDFPYVKFGNSDDVQVGDNVLAMGSPLSISQSVTSGIVSNTEMVMPRRMGMGNLELDGEDVGNLVKWIAHDAVIYPGNSGGPLVNISGEIIGINEISFGLGGAIPGNLAQEVADALIKNGSVARSWLGITVQPLLKKEDRTGGVLVTGSIEGSPAEKAGIRPGDIMIRLNGQDTTVRYDEELPRFNRLVAGLPLDADVEAIVLRDRNEMALTMRTTEREPRRPREREFKEWGITGRNLSYINAKELKRDTTDGVSITSVAPGGPAGDTKPSVRRGDILTKVGDQPVRDIDELARISRELVENAADPVPVLATFERKATEFVAAVNVGLRELNDPGLEVKKAWLPVNTQVITREIAGLLGDSSLTGFRITQVFATSTAESAGLETGDLIVAVDGQRLMASAPEHYEELPTLIRNYSVGSTAELSIRRGSEELKVPVELVRAPKLDREMRKYRDENFEFTVRDVTFFDKADEQWDDTKTGVLVSEIQPGSWAELGMLRVGDLIQEVDGEAVNNVDDMQAVMEQIESAQEQFVIVQALRGIYTVYVELEPKWDQN